MSDAPTPVPQPRGRRNAVKTRPLWYSYPGGMVNLDEARAVTLSRWSNAVKILVLFAQCDSSEVVWEARANSECPSEAKAELDLAYEEATVVLQDIAKRLGIRR